MQSLATFFEENKPLAYGATVAAVLVLIIVVSLLYRLLFGRRLRAATNGRARQPRLGIVDAYDLDRQRQLVLVRRDNVEHLIMIGGPTDVVIESAIVRTQSAPLARDKDGAAPMLGTVTAPALTGASPALTGAAPAAALPAGSPAASLPAPGAGRSEPVLGRGEPSLAMRGEAPPRNDATPRNEPARVEPSLRGEAPPRTEPALGMPMPSPMPTPAPAMDRPDRGAGRPIAVPDPEAPASVELPPLRPAAPPRPSSLPPRPAPVPPSGGAGAAPGTPPADRPARPPLPPRPLPTRPPLPPRPSLASGLAPRPARPLPTGGPPPAVVAESEAPAPRVEPAPPKPIETLESLEEEMAKLLGRPAPRRDG